MQDILTNPPQWLQTAFTVLASAVTGGGIVKLYNVWLNRNKPAAEIHLTEATAAEIKVRAHSNAGDALTRMMDRLDGAQVTIDGLYDTINRLRSERDEFKMRKELLEIEAKSLRDQVDSAYAYVKFLGKHPTDVDRFRVELKSEEKKLNDT
jgi:chromosome segregation ATPase